jgi:transketolase
MDKFIAKTQEEMPNIASRKASQNAIEAMGPLLPEMLFSSIVIPIEVNSHSTFSSFSCMQTEHMFCC